MPSDPSPASDSLSIIHTLPPFVNTFSKTFLSFLKIFFWGALCASSLVRGFCSIPSLFPFVKGVFESSRNFLVFYGRRRLFPVVITKNGAWAYFFAYTGAVIRREKSARFASYICFASLPPNRLFIEVSVLMQTIVSAGSEEKPG